MPELVEESFINKIILSTIDAAKCHGIVIVGKRANQSVCLWMSMEFPDFFMEFERVRVPMNEIRRLLRHHSASAAL